MRRFCCIIFAGAVRQSHTLHHCVAPHPFPGRPTARTWSTASHPSLAHLPPSSRLFPAARCFPAWYGTLPSPPPLPRMHHVIFISLPSPSAAPVPQSTNRSHPIDRISPIARAPSSFLSPFLHCTDGLAISLFCAFFLIHLPSLSLPRVFFLIRLLLLPPRSLLLRFFASATSPSSSFSSSAFSPLARPLPRCINGLTISLFHVFFLASPSSSLSTAPASPLTVPASSSLLQSVSSSFSSTPSPSSSSPSTAPAHCHQPPLTRRSCLLFLRVAPAFHQ